MRRVVLVWIAGLAAWLGQAAPASAHRLDEYLQATRVSIAIDRVDLEIDLTPGAAMAATAFAWIDTDGDGQLSVVEGNAYAQRVLGAVLLSADGRAVEATLAGSQFPDLASMQAGVGTIRLRAVARIPATSAGRHAIAYVNAYRPDASVYLANALVPSDRRISIAGQQRDPLQRSLTLEYDVARDAWSRTLILVGGLAIVGLLGLARRDRSGRRKGRESFAAPAVH